MRFATPLQHELEGWGDSSAVIVAMGLALAVAGLVQALATPAAQPVVALELFVSLLVPTGLATGGYWLASRNVSSDIRWRVVTWVSVGIVAACGLGLWILFYVALEGGTIHGPLSLAAVGGATGFVAAVRATPAIAPAGSIDLGADRQGPHRDAAAPSTDTERSAVAEANPTETTDCGPDSSTERPTAAAAGVTVTTTESTIDDATTPEIASETAMTPSTAPPAKTETAPTVWQDTDPEGRTAAPVHPADTSAPVKPTDLPDPACDEDSGASVNCAEPAAPARPVGPAARDGTDDRGNSQEATDRAVPVRDPGVEAVTAVSSTAETTLEVLQQERARITLAVIYHEWDDEPRSVDQLARAVSSHTDDAADAVELGLRHATLPQLWAIRAVDWDQYTDQVSAPDHAVFEEGVREASILLETFEPGTR